MSEVVLHNHRNSDCKLRRNWVGGLLFTSVLGVILCGVITAQSCNAQESTQSGNAQAQSGTASDAQATAGNTRGTPSNNSDGSARTSASSSDAQAPAQSGNTQAPAQSSSGLTSLPQCDNNQAPAQSGAGQASLLSVRITKLPPRVVMPMQRLRTWRRPREYLSSPIRMSPKRYSGPVLTGICSRCMTFTRRFHPLEASSGVSVATLFFSARGMRMNCRQIFPSAPITFSDRETTSW